MELKNSFVVPQSAAEAWPILMDVQRVVACMPGVTLDRLEDEDIHASMKVKLGPIQLRYQGQARFTERDEDARRVVVEASGRETKGAGTATATVRMWLEERGDESMVNVHTDLALTGRPAQFGSGAIQDVTAKLIDQFAERLSAELSSDLSPGLNGSGETPGKTIPGVAPVAAAARTTTGQTHEAGQLNLLDLLDPALRRKAAAAGWVLSGVLLASVVGRMWRATHKSS